MKLYQFWIMVLSELLIIWEMTIQLFRRQEFLTERARKKVNTDSGLIKYLMRHWHSTPFEMCEIKYHIKLPIFIARQWIRHRTANVNEYSARYSILDKILFTK